MGFHFHIGTPPSANGADTTPARVRFQSAGDAGDSDDDEESRSRGERARPFETAVTRRSCVRSANGPYLGRPSAGGLSLSAPR